MSTQQQINYLWAACSGLAMVLLVVVMAVA